MLIVVVFEGVFKLVYMLRDFPREITVFKAVSHCCVLSTCVYARKSFLPFYFPL